MGTRHLIEVKFNNELKVAQYGQWDGYPTGQGSDIASFIVSEDNIRKLKQNLSKCRFFDEKKDITPEQVSWVSNFISRDIGSGILKNIANSQESEILLKDCSEFKKDGLYCEYYYLIDLDKEIVFLNGTAIPFVEFTKGKMELLEKQRRSNG